MRRNSGTHVLNAVVDRSSRLRSSRFDPGGVQGDTAALSGRRQESASAGTELAEVRRQPAGPAQVLRHPVRAPRARRNSSSPSRSREPRDLPRTCTKQRASHSPLRRAGAPCIRSLRNPRPWLPTPSLRRLRPRPPARLLVQTTRILPFLRWKAHVGHGCAPSGSRSPGGADPAVGADAPLPPSLPLCLRREAHQRGAAGISSSALRRASPAYSTKLGCTSRPMRCCNLHPAVWFSAELERSLPYPRSGRCLYLHRREVRRSTFLPAAAPEQR